MTGGSGFIGKPTVHALRSRGHTVGQLKARLSNIGAVKRELATFNPDSIIHLAWEGIPDYGGRMSAKNLRQGKALFDAAASLGIPKIVAAGTFWQHERGTPTGRARFVRAKNELERYGMKAMKKSGGTFIWTIPAFVYGHGQKSASLIPSLARIARKGQPPMPKNPSACQDFVYVDDVARAIVVLATKKVPSGRYDIGSGKLTRTGDIARIVAKKYKIKLPKMPRGRLRGRAADISPLVRATKWKPHISIKHGVLNAIASL